MRVLINALSVTNLSGRHVLLGHLTKLALWAEGEHEYFVLYNSSNKDICRDLGRHVRWIECPSFTSHWAYRTLWEHTYLRNEISRLKADFIFTPSGTTISRCPVPQVSFAQNPWSLVRGLKRSGLEQIKAVLQRKAYRNAMHEATMMVFNSEYMRRAYRENAGFSEKSSAIVYQGIDDETHSAAEVFRKAVVKGKYAILSVSVMAPHKGADVLALAVGKLVHDYKIPVKLSFVGPWPDSQYQKKVKRLITNLDIENNVTIAGFVSKDRLHRYYAESKIFCLMSRCESFGIPAVEAQAFGTPVVSSNCCAIPEVCGEGGIYLAPEDYEGTAQAIAQLLAEEGKWEALSEAAQKNAAKYRWDICSKPLLQMFNIMADRVKH